MKKLLIALFVVTALLFSCKAKEDKTDTTKVEPDKVKVEKKEMSFDQVKDIIGSEAAAKLVPENATAKGRPNKAVIIVWFGDLVLTQISGGYNTTLPANPKWGGVQKLSSFSSLCNWYLVGTTETNKNCMTDSTGTIRAWATDSDDNVHVSNIMN